MPRGRVAVYSFRATSSRETTPAARLADVGSAAICCLACRPSGRGFRFLHQRLQRAWSRLLCYVKRCAILAGGRGGCEGGGSPRRGPGGLAGPLSRSGFSGHEREPPMSTEHPKDAPRRIPVPRTTLTLRITPIAPSGTWRFEVEVRDTATTWTWVSVDAELHRDCEPPPEVVKLLCDHLGVAVSHAASIRDYWQRYVPGGSRSVSYPRRNRYLGRHDAAELHPERGRPLDA